MQNENPVKQNKSKVKKVGKFIAKQVDVRDDLFSSIKNDIKFAKDEFVSTKEGLKKEIEHIKSKSEYSDYEGLLKHFGYSMAKLQKLYSRHSRFCYLILLILVYLLAVAIEAADWQITLMSCIFSFPLILFYIRYRMWLFMIEKKRFVKIGEWLRELWSYPSRFFPKRKSKVFVDYKIN